MEGPSIASIETPQMEFIVLAPKVSMADVFFIRFYNSSAWKWILKVHNEIEMYIVKLYIYIGRMHVCPKRGFICKYILTI